MSCKMQGSIYIWPLADNNVRVTSTTGRLAGSAGYWGDHCVAGSEIYRGPFCRGLNKSR